MDSKFIIAICMIGLYLIILIIVRILAYIYSIKHKPYKKVNDEYLKEIAEFKKNESATLKNLKSIKTKFKLSIDEKIYFVEELNIFFNHINVKKNKKNEFDDEYDQYIKTLKKNYSSFKFKSKQNNFEKSLVYISNKRIVLDDEKEYKVIKLENVLLNEYIVLNFNGIYYKGVYLKTKNEAVYMLTDDLKLNSIISKFRLEQA